MLPYRLVHRSVLNKYCQPTWHVPNDDEIDFALQIFRELVDPTLIVIEDLFKPGLYIILSRSTVTK